MSNRNMVRGVCGLILVLFNCVICAQSSHPDTTNEALIERVKNLRVSSLDSALPDVTLEFFLQYEGQGAPINWELSDCGERKRNPAVGDEQASTTCVQADIDLKDDRSAAVVVSMGMAEKNTARPKVVRVTVTDRDGSTHAVRRLRNLPMELHRPLPKWPRDLPLPAGAALSLAVRA